VAIFKRLVIAVFIFDIPIAVFMFDIPTAVFTFDILTSWSKHVAVYLA
jgi:hypothetical protein